MDTKRAAKIKGIIRKIKIIHNNPDKPLIIFDLGICRVTLNEKGWICDRIENIFHYRHRCKLAKESIPPRQEPMRFSCSFRPDQKCWHIEACQEYVKRLGEIKREKEEQKDKLGTGVTP